jgi:hypothetical protein
MEEIKQETVETKKEEECRLCKDDAIMVFLSVAHGACERIPEEELKKECKAWADAIDPTKIESAADIAYETLVKTGGAGIQETALIFNEGTKTAVMRRVNEMLKNGMSMEDIKKQDEVLMKYYQVMLKQEGGI